MDEELKGKLDRAFDEDCLGELPKELLRAAEADADAARYLSQLRALDKPLAKPPEIEIPTLFRETVMQRLPGSRSKRFKTLRLSDLFLPLYLAALFIFAVIFRDALGITALLDLIGDSLSISGEGGLELAFALVSSIGILLATWLIVGSFFGIRSRRTSR